jgi:hypothetical protein
MWAVVAEWTVDSNFDSSVPKMNSNLNVHNTRIMVGDELVFNCELKFYLLLFSLSLFHLFWIFGSSFFSYLSLFFYFFHFPSLLSFSSLANFYFLDFSLFVFFLFTVCMIAAQKMKNGTSLRIDAQLSSNNTNSSKVLSSAPGAQAKGS